MLALMLFSMPLVVAQEIATQTDIQEAGITPDSPFYGIDLAFEKLAELFNKNAKLLHAQERLAEVKTMLQEGKINEAEEARLEFEKVRLRIQNATQIQEHTALMNQIQTKIQDIGLDSQLTEQQKNEFATIIQAKAESIAQENSQIEVAKVTRQGGQ